MAAWPASKSATKPPAWQHFRTEVNGQLDQIGGASTGQRVEGFVDFTGMSDPFAQGLFHGRFDDGHAQAPARGDGAHGFREQGTFLAGRQEGTGAILQVEHQGIETFR